MFEEHSYAASNLSSMLAIQFQKISQAHFTKPALLSKIILCWNITAILTLTGGIACKIKLWNVNWGEFGCYQRIHSFSIIDIPASEGSILWNGEKLRHYHVFKPKYVLSQTSNDTNMWAIYVPHANYFQFLWNIYPFMYFKDCSEEIRWGKCWQNLTFAE